MLKDFHHEKNQNQLGFPTSHGGCAWACQEKGFVRVEAVLSQRGLALPKFPKDEQLLKERKTPRPHNVPPLSALWSLLVGIWGILNCSWGGAGKGLETRKYGP